MRVYQPVGHDAAFRLAADLTPEDSEDSISSPTLSSEEEEEEAKVRTFADGSGHTRTSAPSPPPAHGASLAPSKNAKEIYNQGHISVQQQAAPDSGTCNPDSASPCPASSKETGPPSEELGGQWNGEVNSNLTTENSTATTAQPTSAYITAAQPCSPGAATLTHGVKRRADDSHHARSPLPPHPTPPVQDARSPRTTDVCHEGRRSVSDDDDDSIEDVSISHNVPMCPPSPSPLTPSRSLAPRGRVVVVAAAEERGGASGCWSDAEHCAGSRTSGLRLAVHNGAEYHGPYTLACDVTPSPMQEQVTLASTQPRAGNNVSGHVTAATTCSTATVSNHGGASNNGQLKVPRRPRKLPEIPRKHQGLATASSTHVRSIFDEIQEALIKEAGGEVFDGSSSSSSSASEAKAAQQYPYIHKHVGHLFDKKRLLIGYASSGPSRSRHSSVSSVSCRSRTVSTCSAASEAGAAASVLEDTESTVASYTTPLLSPSTAFPSSSSAPTPADFPLLLPRRRSGGQWCSPLSTPYQDMEVTHRGLHRFIPRHADEVQIGIGDPIHVIREYDDLWCEGVNLRSGERGIFPVMYANDLTFLEDSDGDDEHWKFTMRFLGAVEVTSSSGDFALCQAINKVAQQARVKTASLCTLEINQYGIRMIDKSKEGHESQKFSNFFALKNISFCGTHPNNNRYFAFITKHPRELRFACHVFHSDRSTHRARDALGNAFKRFYQEYMAFTHPTEDIWME